MAREAARLLDGSGWLPEVLRYPADEIAEEVGTAETNDAVTVNEEDVEAGDVVLPAFLTEELEAEQTAADTAHNTADDTTE